MASILCEGVTIEDELFIGQGVAFINDPYPRATTDGQLQTEQDWKVEPTWIKRGASIGSGTTILSKATIGERAILGAGSVVTKDVPDDAIVAGNPAKVRRVLAAVATVGAPLYDPDWGKEAYRLVRIGADPGSKPLGTMISAMMAIARSKGTGEGRELPAYILITPARNEAQFIEQTIRCVIAQTVRPVKWLIVSDGSTDGTDEIVKKYLQANSWIELLRMPERSERHFAGKVSAFNAARAKAAILRYDIIGNLDADVSFENDYFEFLMSQFAENPSLGVAGTAFSEDSRQYDYRFTNIEHVSGQIQLFRVECFDAIGGYQPRKLGGIDWVAVTTARMKGWRTRTFTEKIFVHHRRMSSGMYSGLALPFRGGQKDYLLGNHPAWELFRCIYQTTRPPVLIGGGLRLAGFIWAMCRQMDREMPVELIRFAREEQLCRLRKLISNTSGVRPEAMKEM